MNSHDLPVDFAIPGYEIIGKLWEGSMSTVFKARQLSVDRVVAIKVLRAPSQRPARAHRANAPPPVRFDGRVAGRRVTR